MATLGTLVGAFIAMFLISRLTLWATKKMGDTEVHIFVAHGIALAFATIAAAYGFAYTGSPNFGAMFLTYGIPTAVWLAVDIFALKGRRGAT